MGEMLKGTGENVKCLWKDEKKVDEMFGGMKNILYLCIVKSNQGVAHNLRALR